MLINISSSRSDRFLSSKGKENKNQTNSLVQLCHIPSYIFCLNEKKFFLQKLYIAWFIFWKVYEPQTPHFGLKTKTITKKEIKLNSQGIGVKIYINKFNEI